MTRSGLLVWVASVIAGTTVLLGVFGLVYNPILLLAALPFGAAAYFLWSHATGRLEPRVRERARRERPRPEGGRPGAVRPGSAGGRGPKGRSGPAPADVDAARVLGVEVDADEAELRRAYRERAKALHPDAADGDEAAFQRARAAYERLRDGR